MEETNELKFTRSQKKRCDEYATEVLGAKKFAPWLYVYTVAQGQFHEG